MQYLQLNPNISPEEAFGYIPRMLDPDNPASIILQLHRGYLHGGGWRRFYGFRLRKDFSLSYPREAPLYPLAALFFRPWETLIIYPYGWVLAWTRVDYQIARMD